MKLRILQAKAVADWHHDLLIYGKFAQKSAGSALNSGKNGLEKLRQAGRLLFTESQARAGSVSPGGVTTLKPNQLDHEIGRLLPPE
ncbi:hypothetical protein [Hartmannibacter diazotrophicus]|uniref:hypothetical protein n=1 Tax=Hartmannibacter diazotrophicus TaxID=1482074 RepID=UPI0012FE6522|nr:hypothetical protein [Hartmannibacter diazotrophicus]